MRDKIVTEDKKNRKKSRITVLDIVIVLLIITSLVGVYFRYSILDTLSGRKNLKEYIVSFEIEKIKYTIESHVNIGDKVYFYDDGAEMGTLIEEAENFDRCLSVKPAFVKYAADTSTDVKEYAYPENTYVYASGRIKCVGRYSEDGGFLINGKRAISPNDTIKVKTEFATFTIKITYIDPVEN